MAVGAVAAVYLAFFNEDAPERLALSYQPAPTASVPTSTPAAGSGAATPTVASPGTDNRIRTGGLQTNQFSKATFASTKAIPLPAEAVSGQAVKASAEGDLTLHGVTKRVTIPLDVRVTGGKGELVGSLSFPMSDFAINPPNVGGFVTVDPDATLEFKLILEKT